MARPSLWSTEYGGTAPENIFEFHCPALKQFIPMKQTIEINNPTWSSEEVHEKLDKMCMVYDEALEAGFIAYEYLPMPSTGGFIDDDGPLDLNSIMLYSSRRNGKPTPFGQPGKVLVLRDTGEEFQEATKPSTKDVEVSLPCPVLILFLFNAII
ncbi:hypothetical protein SLS62_001797 [Diatrype stigma]|uniref:Uncharacterized protein n=1 Tax=Diatrype stigma TaxID=117547 RepID=A0AAN9UVA1_9PEZI